MSSTLTKPSPSQAGQRPLTTLKVEWRLQAAMRGAAPASGPQRGLVALSLAGWIGLATTFSRGELLPFCATGGWGDRGGATSEAALTTGAIQDGFLHWVMMVAAMMSPLLMPPARHVAGCSFRPRRARAVSAILVGYGAVWMVAGAAAASMNVGLRAVDVTLTAGQAVLPSGLAVAWQLSNWRAAALRRCHQTRAIAAVGVRADWSCARYGISHASACVTACWTVMAGVMLAEASLVLPLRPGSHRAALPRAGELRSATLGTDGDARPGRRWPACPTMVLIGPSGCVERRGVELVLIEDDVNEARLRFDR